MQHLEVSGAVRPLKWSLGVKWLIFMYVIKCALISRGVNELPEKVLDIRLSVPLTEAPHDLKY